jgi:CheY-like chemotaxis protein
LTETAWLRRKDAESAILTCKQLTPAITAQKAPPCNTALAGAPTPQEKRKTNRARLRRKARKAQALIARDKPISESELKPTSDRTSPPALLSLEDERDLETAPASCTLSQSSGPAPEGDTDDSLTSSPADNAIPTPAPVETAVTNEQRNEPPAAIASQTEPDRGESSPTAIPSTDASAHEVTVATPAPQSFDTSTVAAVTVTTIDGSGTLAGTAGSKPRILRRALVVDDDPVIRMLLEMGLERYGYECVTAEHGKAAQAIMETNRFDVLVVDLLMPVMDGLSFIRWLRKTLRDKTPVLVFTNVDDIKIAREAVACGANALAGKPMPLKEIVAAMNNLVHARDT